MRYLSFVLLSIASSSFAQGVRFTGSGVADTNYGYVRDQDGNSRYDVGGSITFEGEYADDITVPLIHPNWTFDITTDGQSVTIHDMTVSYDGTLYINPLVWLELSVEAKIEDLTVDINPSTTTVWTVQEHSFYAMDVSGVYHGIGLTQTFSGSLPDYSSYEQGLLDFVNWPNELAWEARAYERYIDGSYVDASDEYRKFSAPSSGGWIGVEPYLHIREIKVWEPVSVTLIPVVESADFNEDSDIDGADFLTWQRGYGITNGAILSQGDANCDGAVDNLDLSIWQTQFVAVAMPVATAIPEPSTLLLSLLGLSAVGISRRRKSMA